MISTALIALWLAAPSEMPPLGNEEPPAGALQGQSSARLALPVVVTFDEKWTDEETPLTGQNGNVKGKSTQPRLALSGFTLGIARRHFEDARWGDPKGKGRYLVLKSVSVVTNPGPTYQVTVVVDRYQDGRRLGQASGQGFAYADRTSEHMAASFAGPFAGLASQSAMQPSAKKDAAIIRIATLRALDSALLQLAAYWSGEQLMEQMQQQNAKKAGK